MVPTPMHVSYQDVADWPHTSLDEWMIEFIPDVAGNTVSQDGGQDEGKDAGGSNATHYRGHDNRATGCVCVRMCRCLIGCCLATKVCIGKLSRFGCRK